jgi:pyrroloquinoline quinone (PQQ) biosynthesis protein C
MMTIMPDEGLQVALADIIADEFGLELVDSQVENVCSHPELFRRFMRSLGLSELEWDNAPRVSGIDWFRQVHYSLFRLGLVDETVGAIVFACENATPYRHSRVAAGLAKFSARTGTSVDYTFFSAHVTLDVHHTESLVNLILPWLDHPERVERIRRGIQISCDARKVFLDDVYVKLRIVEGSGI